jgi:hypothetical protein
VQQRVELNGLVMKSAAPCLIALTGVLHGAEAGDDDRDDLGIALERGLEDGPAVDAGQAEVGHDDVEGELSQPGEGVFAARGLLDDEAVIGEPLRNGLPQRDLVVYEEQMFRVFSHLVVRRYFDTRAAAVNAGLHGPPYSRAATLPITLSDRVMRGVREATPLGKKMMDRKTISIMKACELVGCQPPHHLQLDRQRQGRVHPDRRRLGAHLRGHALAGSRARRGAHAQRSLMMPAADDRTRAAGETRATWAAVPPLNNQLGIILANAELLEAKSADEMARARAAQVVASVLDAMTTAREIRLRSR